MPPKELVDEIKKAYNEYKKEKEKEVDYLTFYNGFVACNRNRQQENNKLLDVINNQDVKIADLEQQIEKMKCCGNCKHLDKLYNRCELTRLTLKSCLCNSLDKWEIEK